MDARRGTYLAHGLRVDSRLQQSGDSSRVTIFASLEKRRVPVLRHSSTHHPLSHQSRQAITIAPFPRNAPLHRTCYLSFLTCVLSLSGHPSTCHTSSPHPCKTQTHRRPPHNSCHRPTPPNTPLQYCQHLQRPRKARELWYRASAEINLNCARPPGALTDHQVHSTHRQSNVETFLIQKNMGNEIYYTKWSLLVISKQSCSNFH